LTQAKTFKETKPREKEKAMQRIDLVKVFLLGVGVTLLAVLVFRPETRIALAQEGPVQSGSLMALTGPDKATLFLVDTSSKQIAQYSIDTKGLLLESCRTYKSDLLLEDEHKSGGMSVKEVEKLANAQTGKGPK
jgi:hypothetical protein